MSATFQDTAVVIAFPEPLTVTQLRAAVQQALEIDTYTSLYEEWTASGAFVALGQRSMYLEHNISIGSDFDQRHFDASRTYSTITVWFDDRLATELILEAYDDDDYDGYVIGCVKQFADRLKEACSSVS